jgi:hypothetical protein
MTQRFSLPQVLLMLAAGFIVIGAPRPAAAEAGACKDLVGTYLTKNFAKGESSGSFTSRSLIALSGSWPGLVHRFRRRRRGGFGPFTDGRGSWRCIEANKADAITLDFTTPAADAPGRRSAGLTLASPMTPLARPSRALRRCA